MDVKATTYIKRLKALQCVVLIPTYNNAGTIAQVIADVKLYAPDIIVVNDGSTDNTAEILKNIDVLVDGKFVEELKSPDLLFRGSSNQRIIDVKKSLEENELVLLEEKDLIGV